ncbi:MAG: glycine zipper 2TM domain-containing protein [Roseateles sp.]|uniref:glycine zipper 2TM domain-containing protein n=1 Tax=Roseateles sp. TaxID=1971397 RepID=UPI0039E8328B
MSTAAPVKSTQIVAGVAVVAALLGGAYAMGRSQGSQGLTAPEPVTAAAPAPQRLAADTPLRETRPAPAAKHAQPAPQQAQAALCQGCARVTSVYTETRRGKASGVGAVGGAVVGGLLGNMVGGGNGRKLATVAGAVGGGYAGHEIEKNQKSHTVWVVQVQERDGRTRRFERSADPGLRVGDEVRLTENGFVRD